MYRFSRGQTKPQAIVILSSLMMFIVVAINGFVYLLIPQYSIYGDQNYIALENVGRNLFLLNCFTKENRKEFAYSIQYELRQIIRISN